MFRGLSHQGRTQIEDVSEHGAEEGVWTQRGGLKGKTWKIARRRAS
jgi:hypothetical protein